MKTAEELRWAAVDAGYTLLSSLSETEFSRLDFEGLRLMRIGETIMEGDVYFCRSTLRLKPRLNTIGRQVQRDSNYTFRRIDSQVTIVAPSATKTESEGDRMMKFFFGGAR